jgi:hypothetical protein
VITSASLLEVVPDEMGLEGIVSKRLGSRYVSGRSPDWLKFKNPEAPAVKREAEEDWNGRAEIKRPRTGGDGAEGSEGHLSV